MSKKRMKEELLLSFSYKTYWRVNRYHALWNLIKLHAKVGFHRRYKDWYPLGENDFTSTKLPLIYRHQTRIVGVTISLATATFWIVVVTLRVDVTVTTTSLVCWRYVNKRVVGAAISHFLRAMWFFPLCGRLARRRTPGNPYRDLLSLTKFLHSNHLFKAHHAPVKEEVGLPHNNTEGAESF